MTLPELPPELWMLIVSNWRLLGIPRVDVEHRKILRSLAVVSTSLRAAAQPLLFGCIGIEVPTSFGRINASEYRLRSLLQMSLQHPGAARWPKILYVFSSRGFIPLSHPLLLSIARLLEHFEALGELRILDVPITIRMLQAISRLAELEKLTFVDCDAVGSSGDVNTVIHCHNLKYLALRYASTISPLRVFELGMHCALKTLEISSPTILSVLHQLGSDHELPTLTELIVASFKYTMQGPLSALLQLCPNIKNLKLDHHCGRTTEESPVPWPAAPDHSMLCLKIFSGPFQCAAALIPRRPVEVMRICCAGREDVAQLAYASVPVKILELAGLHWHDGCLNTIANSFPGLEELALVDLAHDYMPYLLEHAIGETMSMTALQVLRVTCSKETHYGEIVHYPASAERRLLTQLGEVHPALKYARFSVYRSWKRGPDSSVWLIDT